MTKLYLKIFFAKKKSWCFFVDGVKLFHYINETLLGMCRSLHSPLFYLARITLFLPLVLYT